MKLPKGITGFKANSQKEEFETSNNDLRNIVGLIRAYRQHEILAVLDITSSSNYYRIRLKEIETENKYDLLINPIKYFSCCVTPNSQWMKLNFIDFPDILIQVLQEHINIIDQRVLNKIAEDQDLQELDNVELEQIKYWKTQKIGEIIFNGYD